MLNNLPRILKDLPLELTRKKSKKRIFKIKKTCRRLITFVGTFFYFAFVYRTSPLTPYGNTEPKTGSFTHPRFDTNLSTQLMDNAPTDRKP